MFWQFRKGRLRLDFLIRKFSKFLTSAKNGIFIGVSNKSIRIYFGVTISVTRKKSKIAKNVFFIENTGKSIEQANCLQNCKKNEIENHCWIIKRPRIGARWQSIVTTFLTFLITQFLNTRSAPKRHLVDSLTILLYFLAC